MKVRRDNKSNTFHVTLTEAELRQAFETSNHLLYFLHTLTALTYGEKVADDAFPIMKGEQ